MTGTLAGGHGCKIDRTQIEDLELGTKYLEPMATLVVGIRGLLFPLKAPSRHGRTSNLFFVLIGTHAVGIRLHVAEASQSRMVSCILHMGLTTCERICPVAFHRCYGALNFLSLSWPWSRSILTKAIVNTSGVCRRSPKPCTKASYIVVLYFTLCVRKLWYGRALIHRTSSTRAL